MDNSDFSGPYKMSTVLEAPVREDLEEELFFDFDEFEELAILEEDSKKIVESFGFPDPKQRLQESLKDEGFPFTIESWNELMNEDKKPKGGLLAAAQRYRDKVAKQKVDEVLSVIDDGSLKVNAAHLQKMPKFTPELAGLVAGFLLQEDAKDLSGKTIQVAGNLAYLDSFRKKFYKLIHHQELSFSQPYIFSGGFNKTYKNKFALDTILMKRITKKYGLVWDEVLFNEEALTMHTYLDIKLDKLVYEFESSNTREHFEFAKRDGVYDILNTKNLVVFAPSLHALRCKLTAQAVNPEFKSVETISYPEALPFKSKKLAELFQVSVETLNKKGLVGNLSRSLAWSEVLRITRYGKKGDLKIDLETALKLENIFNCVKSLKTKQK